MKLTAQPHRDNQGVHHPPIWDLVNEEGLLVATVWQGGVEAQYIARKASEPAPLLPDELLKLVRQAIADPGRFLPRGDDHREPIWEWSARAVVKALTSAEPEPEPEQTYQLGDVAEITFSGGKRIAVFIPEWTIFTSERPAPGAWLWSTGHCYAPDVKDVRLLRSGGTP